MQNSKVSFFRCITAAASVIWTSCATPSPSMALSSTPSAWFSSTSPTLTCASAPRLYHFFRPHFQNHHPPREFAESRVAVEKCGGLVAHRKLQLERPHTALPAIIFDFVKRQRPDSLVTKLLLDKQIAQHALRSAILEFKVIGQQSVSHRLLVVLHKPHFALRRIPQQCVQPLAQRFAMSGNFFKFVVRDHQFQQCLVILGAAGAE